MIESRRHKFSGLKSDQASHTGLWLDRYLAKQIQRGEKLEPKEEKPLVTVMSQAATLPLPDPYQSFFTRWEQALATLGAQCRMAQVLGRMVVGLGDESVLETSVALHHTYGVPYIPGSALKGMAARYVRDRLDDTHWGHWEGEGDRKIWVAGPGYRVIFGDTTSAGYITFFDALYVAESGHKNDQGKHQALWPDVITVHHPGYYQGKGAPADWDSPTPIPFLSATGSYLVALSGSERWLDATFDILGHALRELGIGAKTSSGYGRMELEEKLVDPIQTYVQDLQERIATLSIGRVTNDINKFYQEWIQLEASLLMRQRIAQAILDKVAQADRVKASAEKSWYRNLIACVSEKGGQ
ncbi:MAG: type III-B CRISPR module RAMP protein Cmr6 [Chloroflexales bacterium]|nr:type III-B CRISPR module RAMP protein Cmr6 [Chloroflexales bacterium]